MNVICTDKNGEPIKNIEVTKENPVLIEEIKITENKKPSNK